MLDTDPVGDVVDVLDDSGEGRVCIECAIGPDVADEEGDPQHAAGCTDRVDLLVRQVSRRRAERVCRAVGDNQRGVRDLFDVPESLLGDMGEVYEDTEFIAAAHQAFAALGQTRAGVRGRWMSERNARAEDIGSAPDRSEREESGLVEDIEHR